MKNILIGFLFLLINTALASPSPLQAENIEYLYHEKAECYAGWVVEPSSDNAFEKKFNLPDDIIHEYEMFLTENDETIVIKDNKGNQYTYDDIEARCFKNEGTIILYDAERNNYGNNIALGRDSKTNFVIQYEGDSMIVSEVTGYYKNSEPLVNMNNRPCRNITEYTRESRAIEIKVFKQIIKNGCLSERIEYYEKNSIIEIAFYDESGRKDETLKREDLMDKSEYIPMFRVCINRYGSDREDGNKFIEKTIENIKKGIEYGLVSRTEMNNNNKKGQLFADAKMKSFDSSIKEFCSIFDLAASDYKIKNSEDPY